jgi:elongation factor 2
MTEMIRPVLMVNKIDRQILELKLGAEEMYQNFVRVIDLVNVIISNYDYPDMADLFVYPNKGNVAFGSGKECWAFTITKFARIYAKKYNVDFEKMMQKLWGDNYFDPVSKKWYNDPEGEGGQYLKRAFCPL